MTRIATREKLTAIVKMRFGKSPPHEYIRMKIGGDKKTGGEIYTIEAYEEDLKTLAGSNDVISLEYSRAIHQLQTIVGPLSPAPGKSSPEPRSHGGGGK